MKKLNLCGVLCAALAIATGAPASAQIGGKLAVPAEIPPASYTGKQYVDSRGCVYIRAGIDGAVTWVPRVARSRKVICGFKPTGISGRQAEAPRTAPKPEVIAIAPEPRSTRPAPQPEPRVVRQVPTQVAPRQAAPRSARYPAPAVVTPVAPRVRRAAVPTTPAPYQPVDDFGRTGQVKTYARSATPACEGASPISQRYINDGKDFPVRCGPQPGPIVTYKGYTKKVKTADGVQRVRVPGVKVYAGKSGATHVTNHTVIAPKAAYARGASEKVELPPGYEPAFKDGRLSTTRAHGTLDGRRKMLLVWTSHTPRRLIDRYTGQDVTHYFPKLRYPYTSMQQQQTAYVSSKGQAPKAAPKVVRKKAAPAVARAASHRFVQVGSFSSPDKAQSAIRRLQSAGLPVRISTYTKGGRAYQIVLAGPFKRQDQLDRALNTVRNRIGYRSASLRK